MDEARSDARATTSSWSRFDLGAVLLAALTECALVVLVARHAIGYHVFMAGHLAVSGGLAGLLVAGSRTGTDRTLLSLAVIATFGAGPLGALGALAAALPARVRGTNEITPLLEAWYERIAHSVAIDPVTQLCEEVAIGRSVDLGVEPTLSFAAVMRHGGLAERQALLGLIARRFDVEYLPALRVALASPEPVIRVQAAAVATKVQLAVARIVRDWHAASPSTTTDGIAALAGCAELEACLASGLLEEADRPTAAEALARLRSIADRAIAEPGFMLRLISARRHPRQLVAQSAFEALLLRERRYRDLRNWRRLQRTGWRSDFRLRPRPRRRRIASTVREAAE